MTPVVALLCGLIGAFLGSIGALLLSMHMLERIFVTRRDLALLLLLNPELKTHIEE